jgi:hypothetical protein
MKETKGIKAFRLFPNGIIQTGGIGGSEKTIFEVGGTYKVLGKPELCKNGFHFYKPENACFGIHLFSGQPGRKTVLHEVIAYGDVVSDNEKCVCCEIKVGKRIGSEVDRNNNSGKGNLGKYNSGNYNWGDYNSGNYNQGYHNSGSYNLASFNRGFFNSGHYDLIDFNIGSSNSFYHKDKFYCFDKPCTPEIWDKAKLPEFLNFIPDWNLNYKENFQKAWETATTDDKKLLEKLPNFNWEIFTATTGIENV